MVSCRNPLFVEVISALTLNFHSYAETVISSILDGKNSSNHRNSGHKKQSEGACGRLQSRSQCLPWKSFHWNQQLWKPGLHNLSHFWGQCRCYILNKVCICGLVSQFWAFLTCWKFLDILRETPFMLSIRPEHWYHSSVLKYQCSHLIMLSRIVFPKTFPF